MSAEEPKTVVIRPTFGLQRLGSGTEKVLARIVSDSLIIARETQIANASLRIRVGEYEFRKSDYEQILIWANFFGLNIHDFVEAMSERELLSGRAIVRGLPEQGELTVEDGTIKRVIFPMYLTTSPFWSGRETYDGAKLDISHVPELILLNCHCNYIGELDISNLYALTALHCGGNQIAALNLSHVPALAKLNCGGNKLTELDLSHVSALTKLNCGSNKLAELALSNIPVLAELDCDGNKLIELTLSNVTALTRLNCAGNKITKLDLSCLPALTTLYCWRNKIDELNLCHATSLTKLDCSKNQLTELDLSNSPALIGLDCRHYKNLKTIRCDRDVKIIKRQWQQFEIEVI